MLWEKHTDPMHFVGMLWENPRKFHPCELIGLAEFSCRVTLRGTSSKAGHRQYVKQLKQQKNLLKSNAYSAADVNLKENYIIR